MALARLDVQRKWVYLEGVFGSPDLKTLLPQESQRFAQIDSEFLSIMKKTAAKPKLMDVINFDGLLKSLERLADMLAKVRKKFQKTISSVQSSRRANETRRLESTNRY